MTLRAIVFALCAGALVATAAFNMGRLYGQTHPILRGSYDR
jgi:hypothetical protein